MEPESEEEHNNRNPMNRAEKEKEFRTAGSSKEVYTKAIDIYNAMSKLTKTFKQVKN